jgi:hypothetical protein
MALGTVVLLIAFVDELVMELCGQREVAQRRSPSQRIETGSPMSDLGITALLVLSLFLILGSGVWIGLTLTGVAWIGMELFSSAPGRRRDGGDDLGLGVELDIDRAALFIWMGEILFRTKLSESMFKGLAPWVNWLPGRCCTPT